MKGNLGAGSTYIGQVIAGFSTNNPGASGKQVMDVTFGLS